MPTGVGDNAGDNARKLLASPTNSENSRVKGTKGKRDSREEAFTATSSSRDKSMSTSRQSRYRRSSSVVIYPEDDEVNKPKIFARQSFIVSGEEEEMAETILKARQLAGERRRSSLMLENVTGKQGQIAAVAQNLAERRNSLTMTDDSLATTRADEATAETDPTEDDASARRRSSVLNRIPDNLRALIQQSDASGVQQKVESPYPQHKAGRSDTGHRKARAAPVRRWFQKLMTVMQWKNLIIKKKRQRSKGSSGGKRKNRGDYVMPISTPTEARYEKKRSLLPSQPPMFSGRKKLVLDLDETLVHSSFKPVPGADYILDINVEGTPYKVFVRKRPGVDEFLKRVARQYEVIVFTASLPAYANPLLDLLDPKGYIEFRLFREHCTFHEGYFVKDLTLLRHESLESTIIVDNSPMAYMFQPENAIDCLSWIDDRKDTELYVIADFLDAIVDVPDVRDLLEFWREGGNVLKGI